MIPYIIKSSLCLALLLAFYHLWLEREKMHLFNRFYLMGSVLFSLLAPLYIIYQKVEYVATPIFVNQTITSNAEIIVKKPFDFTPYIIGVYALVSFVLFVRFGKNLWQIIHTIQNNEHISLENATLVLVEKQIVPHSFLSFIFVNKSDYVAQKITDEVLTHEMTHIRQKHSVDILLIELLQIVFWVNPSLIFLKKAIKLNHEFLADQKVIQTFKNISKYQYLLLETTTCQQKIHLASNLNYSLTKKRLKMMTTTSSKTAMLIKKMAILPLLVGAIFLFAQRVEAQEKPVQEKKPLVIVDGKEIPHKDLDKIPADFIKDITVLKDKSAIEKYGEKGKNGVILVTTKDKSSVSTKTINGEVIFSLKRENGETLHFNRHGQNVEIKDGKVVVLNNDKAVVLKKQKGNVSSKTINNEVIFSLKRENGETLHFNRHGQDVEVKDGKVIVLNKENKKDWKDLEKGWEYVDNGTVFFVKKDGKKTYYNRFGQKVSIKDNKIVVLEDKVAPNKQVSSEKTVQGTVSGTVTSKQGVVPGALVVIKNTSKGVTTDLEGKYRLKAKKGDILVFSFIGTKTTERTVENNSVYDVFLQEEDEKMVEGNKANAKNKIRFRLPSEKGKQPLVIVDGKEVPHKDLNKIPAESIKDITVLKDKSAIEKYGKKGENGVIIVTTKK
ncbi:MAG: carboxypeptidase-like regulatory domain-containing protein [Flavobacteriaceae bacterium]|nr:carboxypeptidase-like regulatory domain-containing protein [Flavobacteriaceae bacterium]